MFIKEIDKNNEYDTTKIEFTEESPCLSQVITSFEDFLRGCGFKIDGHLDIIYNESDDSTQGLDFSEYENDV